MEQREIMQIIRGKRTKRTRPPSSSESTVVTMASFPSTTSSTEEENMANCLMLLAQGSGINNNHGDVYRCKTCDKSFSSFQALGGHRTSHKKAKPTDSDKRTVSFQMAVNDGDDDHDGTALLLRIPPMMMSSGVKSSSKVHECSICRVEFASGQALGGHMRRYRVASPQFPGSGVQMAAVEKGERSSVLELDLNLPAPEEQNLVFDSAKGKLLVFSPSLVDCRY